MGGWAFFGGGAVGTPWGSGVPLPPPTSLNENTKNVQKAIDFECARIKMGNLDLWTQSGLSVTDLSPLFTPRK